MTRVQYEYDPKTIETKWQKKWEGAKLFDSEFSAGKPKKYVLEMFPYPSGKIHMGHVRNYSIGDVMARYFRMRGFNVLHPMGWDAFGLPAENAAIKNKVHPKKWTLENIANMKGQIQRLGVGYDWRREVTTCSEDYYRWEQVMFLKMFREGLAYRKRRPLNWCPSCATVLANEEVVDGLCWRCDSKVEIKEMDQWFFKTTQYAQQLLDGLEKLDKWPHRVKIMQNNWIGRSDGAELDFSIEGRAEKIRVFTTRPDTLFGVTSVILAPEHPLVSKLLEGSPEKSTAEAMIQHIQSMDKSLRQADDAEKLGAFTGRYAIHPLSGEKVPIWIANFVLTEYGTGALMAVPAHDTRDFEFAKKYNLPIKKVVEGGDELPFTEDGISVNSPEINGLKTAEAKAKITKTLEAKKLGVAKVNYRLKDWGISRQRYWGCPIPIIYCAKDGVVEVPESELPVLLPENVVFGEGGSPLARLESFMKTKCPKCGGPATREPDTMATFVESSWYYARYCSTQHGNQPLVKKDCDQWLPIDHYIGGVEHATGHLIYFRFFHKLMRDWGWVSGDEPAIELICQGMVCKDGAKMSKSKGNVVEPDEIIEKFGADTARMFVLFAGPIEKDLEWSEKGVEGCYRFLGRIYRLVINSLEDLKDVSSSQKAESFSATELKHMLHKTIRNVTHDIEKDFHYNTAISFQMEFVNYLYGIDLKKSDLETKGLFKASLEALSMMISPFAPHIADELWENLGGKGFTLNTAWPKYEEEFAKSSHKEVVFQINGKIKDKLIVADGMSDEEMKQLALESPKIKQNLEGKTPRKVIVVPGKLVNIVV